MEALCAVRCAFVLFFSSVLNSNGKWHTFKMGVAVHTIPFKIIYKQEVLKLNDKMQEIDRVRDSDKF